MRIPVGNHFLGIEKPNNVWFTAKVTYDKMDARILFGFQRCSILHYGLHRYTKYTICEKYKCFFAIAFTVHILRDGKTCLPHSTLKIFGELAERKTFHLKNTVAHPNPRRPKPNMAL